eukprot:TRINITY_DN18618_c0_g1_i1.p1 TRINITY_DN18618_c0_g1~~TRINITY_DN18618_c0_g1_i1.p1  ORF type:complete len:1195 (-),score=119.45 TRINITY_DN18618_c0_g1_i1:367-3951(-)
MNFVCHQDGRMGQNAPPGRSGYTGSDGIFGSTGQCGGSGGSAGCAQPGFNGGRIDVQLTSQTDASCTTVSIFGYAERDPVRMTCRDSELGIVYLSAKGGRGGNGGSGGNGGTGGDGGRGQDATRYSNGTDGGNGGNGGCGGQGSNGAAGGNGGSIVVHVPEQDAYLLSAMDQASMPSTLVRGGEGGSKGRHGSGGSGGRGGRGGSSHSWTETVTVKRADGETETVTKQFSNSGGWNGRDGNSGSAPIGLLYSGVQGQNGSFVIRMHFANGNATDYGSCYDLRLRNFELNESPGPQADGIFEFGEVVRAAQFSVSNVGGMPTPALQRIRLAIGRGTFVKPLVGETLFLPRHAAIAPGTSSNVEGHLRFQIGFPNTSMSHDFDPIVVREDVWPEAYQLGVETPHAHGICTSFQRKYNNFKRCQTLVARYPVQNVGGIVGLRSLAAGEWTAVELKLENVSKLPLGIKHRRVRVEFRASLDAGTQASALRLRMMQEDGVLPSQSPAAKDVDLIGGHSVEVEYLGPDQDATIRGQVGIDASMPMYGFNELRAAIFIEDLNQPGKWRCVQRRALPLRCEPAFDPKPSTQAILVCSTATDQEKFHQWYTTLNLGFGFATEVFSLTRYGHFDPTKPLQNEGLGLQRWLPGRVVVILDDAFDETDGLGHGVAKAKRKPSDVLSSWHMSSFMGPSPPHYLIVSEPGVKPLSHLSHLISPITALSSPLQPNREFRKLTDFVHAYKRIQALPKLEDVEQWQPSRDPMLFFDSLPVHMWSGSTPPSRSNTELRLRKDAEKLSAWLKNWRPDLRTMAVVACIREPIIVQKGMLMKTWQVGELRIIGTQAPRDLPERITHATVSKGHMTAQACEFAIARSLATHDRIITLARLIGGQVAPASQVAVAAAQAAYQALQGVSCITTTSEASEKTARLLIHAICADIANEYLRFQSAGMRLPSGLSLLTPKKRYRAFVEDYMPCLAAVLESKDLHVALRNADPSYATFMIGCLEAMADAPGLKRWFAPLGRRRRVGRLLYWAAEHLRKEVGCERRAMRSVAAEVKQDLQNLRGKRGCGPFARAAAAAAVAARFDGTALCDRTNGFKVLHSCGQEPLVLMERDFDHRQRQEISREMRVQEFTKKLVDGREMLCKGENVEPDRAKETVPSAPELESWPEELVAGDSRLPSWAGFDGFSQPLLDFSKFAPSAPPL